MMSLIWGYNVEGVKKRLQKKNERRYNSILYKKMVLKITGRPHLCSFQIVPEIVSVHE